MTLLTTGFRVLPLQRKTGLRMGECVAVEFHSFSPSPEMLLVTTDACPGGIPCMKTMVFTYDIPDFRVTFKTFRPTNLCPDLVTL